MDWEGPLWDDIAQHPYWHNQTTGESTFVDPTGNAPSGPPAQSADPYAGFSNPNYDPAKGVGPGGRPPGRTPPAFVPPTSSNSNDAPLKGFVTGPNGEKYPIYQDESVGPPVSPTTNAARGQLATIGGSVKLIDPTTGAVIQDYGPSGSGAAGASAGASIINNRNSVSEQARQYNEQLAFQKAQFDQKAVADAADRALKEQQGAASLDVHRGDTLLGLGSRPETLIRYLYALRGQQGPQQLSGVAPALPGYPGVNALPSGGAPNVGAPSSSPAVSAGGASSTPPALAGAPNYLTNGTPAQNAIAQQNAANQTAANPSLAAQFRTTPPALAGAPNPLTMGTPAQNAYAQQNAANQTAANPSLAAQFRTTPTAPAPGVDPFASLRPGGIGAPSLPSSAITPQPASFNTTNGPVPLASAQAPGTLSLNGGQMAVGQTYAAPINLPPQTTQNPSTITGYERLANGDIVELGTQTNQRPDYLGGGFFQTSYGQGGVIPEKVVGVGQDSGQTYEFGEKGTEAVMSNDMLQKLMAVAGKVDFHQKGSDGKSSRITLTLNGPPKLDMPKKSDMLMGKTNSYAAGGAIGYSSGKNDYNPQVFNPPNLSGIVGQGFNTPGIPLPPQVNMLTGGGSSLIPSAQTLSNALPSEVGAYSGFLTDEAGVQPNDVFALAKRLAPKVTGVRTPSYGN